jgi:hypothetical protein
LLFGVVLFRAAAAALTAEVDYIALLAFSSPRARAAAPRVPRMTSAIPPIAYVEDDHRDVIDLSNIGCCVSVQPPVNRIEPTFARCPVGRFRRDQRTKGSKYRHGAKKTEAVHSEVAEELAAQ